MKIVNHHAHTTFSDGAHDAETMIRRAVELGMEGYGYSDHAPIRIHDFGNMELDNLKAYSTEIDRIKAAYADRIKVYKSLEVDYIPGLINVDTDYIVAADLDYTVGAVHYVETLDGKPWSFQRPDPSFERGINEIFGGSGRKMVERYFELVREMVRQHPPDVVAHLDRIKKRNPKAQYWDEHDAWFGAEIDRTLNLIADAGIILEVNTRGIYKGEIDETYPSLWIVERANRMGIPLQVNSDAHDVAHITGAFSEVYGRLLRVGVASVKVFDDDQFVERRLG